jgi:hypothetical protein
MKRYAARRDAVEPELVTLARSLGWWLIRLEEPCDWLACRRGVWYPLEIKNPESQGHADEFTPAQVIFHGDASARRAPVLIWRTADDVCRDSASKVVA